MSTRKGEEFIPKLLVEGKDDKHVVLAICQRFDLPKTFGVVDCNGIIEVLKDIPIRIKIGDKYVGILIDADIDIEVRWQQLNGILNPLGYIMENVPNVLGNILKSDRTDTVVGIWVMPNNQISGMLEDFMRILIPADDLLFKHAEKIIEEIQNLKIAKFSNFHTSKALIHTWLSWQEDPGTPMGLALTKSYLNHNHELCLLFVAWLNQLFNPNVIE